MKNSSNHSLIYNKTTGQKAETLGVTTLKNDWERKVGTTEVRGAANAGLAICWLLARGFLSRQGQ